jgi:hypothetical protein
MAGLRIKSYRLYIVHNVLGCHTGSNLDAQYTTSTDFFFNKIHSGSQLTAFIFVVKTQPVLYGKYQALVLRNGLVCVC